MEKITGSSEKIVVDEFEYVHTVKRGTMDFEEGECIQVPGTFSGSKSKNIQWNLTITPVYRKHEDEDEDEEDLDFLPSSQFLVKVNGKNVNGLDKHLYAKVIVSVSIAEVPTTRVVDSKGYVSSRYDASIPYKHISDTIRFGDSNMGKIIWDCPTYTAKMPEATTITCKFTVITCQHVTVSSNLLTGTSSLMGLQKNFGSLLYCADFADISIVTPEAEIPAHKVLLAARSPVFQAMLSSDMLETNNNKIEIADFSKTIVFAMLEYIYTGCTDEVTKSPQEMLQIADKYDLKELREACIPLVFSTLKTENAISGLVMADRYQLKDFKKLVTEFFKKNHMEIAKCEEFGDFVKSNQQLYLEVLGGSSAD